MVETKHKKVLVVDDELGVRRLIYQILSNSYDVFEAQNGEEAISMSNSQQPDIILMDMMMPKMDGFTACSKIKNNETTRKIPVIMVTAIGYELNKKLSADVAGCDGYITKPFNPQELLAAVSHLLKDVPEHN